MDLPSLSPMPDTVSQTRALRDAALHKAAQEMEAAFLAEMLKSAGLGRQQNGFSGGIGEDQFASFLADEQARAMVDHGGIGLSEALYSALKEHDHG